ncbi:MAG: DUF4282 domain-containing protein [Armatimonadetes bacterium]|nr:DUF4282 domain-containing protein [Armatimonadota bacterium]MDW8154000.1 DUF4282 domain-containing protein [Armatimonadota bacterium]
MQAEPRGFFEALFDFSFTSLVTTRLVRVLYILTVILTGVWSLFFLLAGLSRGGGAGLVSLVLALLGFLVAVTYTRVLLEVLVVIFRIHENVQELVSRSRAGQ